MTNMLHNNVTKEVAIKIKYTDAMKACVKNGTRLLDEAELLEFEIPLATKFFLSIIAQEEFAKAFLLYLVRIDVILWNRFILRATMNHRCKQLVGIILDFLTPDTDFFLKRMNDAILNKIPLDFPKKVVDAINILRYEKIGRWESNTWVWAEDPDYDKVTESIAEGQLDKMKQDALYVTLGKDGSVGRTPENTNKKIAEEEYERARRFERLLKDLCVNERHIGSDYERVEDAFKMLFLEEVKAKRY